MIALNFQYLMNKITDRNYTYSEGVVKNVIGLTIEVQGITAFVGEVCKIYNISNEEISCEVVGFRNKDVISYIDFSSIASISTYSLLP